MTTNRETKTMEHTTNLETKTMEHTTDRETKKDNGAHNTPGWMGDNTPGNKDNGAHNRPDITHQTMEHQTMRPTMSVPLRQ